MGNFSWKTGGLIFGFILVVAGAAYGLYYLFFRAEPIPVVDVGEEIDLSALPIAGEGGVVPGEVVTPDVPGALVGREIITREPIFEPDEIDDFAQGGVTAVNDLGFDATPTLVLDRSGQKLLTYNPDNGNFYSLDSDGEQTLLTDKSFPDVESVAWAPQSEKAILEFPDGSNIMYDFSTDRQVTLPKSWTEFDFNDNEDRIAFKDLSASTQRQFLATASPDGSNQKYIEFLGNQTHKVDVQWSPNNQIVATYADANDSLGSRLYLIGQNSENFRSIDVNGYNLEMQYTPDGDRLVYSAQNRLNDHRPTLNIVDSSGDAIGFNHRELNLETWASKCTFQSDEAMYCAVPREMPEGAGWFPELADGIPDDLYRIDLTTGVKSFVAQPELEYTIEQMQISDDGSILYFTDKASQNVHSIRLR